MEQLPTAYQVKPSPCPYSHKIIGVSLLLLLMLGGWIWIGYQQALNKPVVAGQAVTIDIEKGDSLNRIIDKLSAQQVRIKPFWFKVAALQKNALRKLKTGEYE
jgi:UPF0755 protein